MSVQIPEIVREHVPIAYHKFLTQIIQRLTCSTQALFQESFLVELSNDHFYEPRVYLIYHCVQDVICQVYVQLHFRVPLYLLHAKCCTRVEYQAESFQALVHVLYPPRVFQVSCLP